eukprot:CAMPEP_0178468976 /NCGR_PEP_ID=MMETSP0689_2-20121128/53192_1 /TAXON_ID=160604 /ORGANISM="Amphidinium massartii, Strain CS-259" /LENGTH=292 /DNA_ID=CAMNT_0020096039 /DNA_START=90 /DNA_END=968 /DNA_ORIENTATION=-
MPGGFDIVSQRNPVIKDLYRLRLKRRERLRQGLAFVRGRQLIQAIGQHFQFKQVYTHEPREKWLGYRAERITAVPQQLLQHVLFGGTRQQHALRLDDDEFVVGTIKQPPPSEFKQPVRWLLAVDGVKQPEKNMGLLLSSAVALKYDGIFIMGGSVDPFNYKVLEASQGVAWTLPYCYGTAAELISLCERQRLARCSADADGASLSSLPSRPDGKAGFCLAIGNEAHGVTKDVRSGSTCVALPMSELVESLNAGVAGGILMHSLACALGSLTISGFGENATIQGGAEATTTAG